ncbi:MAG: type II secretion system protein GspG [Planctomycetota bacterium]
MQRSDSTREARNHAAWAQFATICDAVLIYLHRHGNLLSSLADLLRPDEKNLGEPYLAGDNVLTDPWGRRLLLRGDREQFEIVSLGRDGAPAGDGWDADVVSTGGLKKGGRR